MSFPPHSRVGRATELGSTMRRALKRKRPVTPSCRYREGCLINLTGTSHNPFARDVPVRS